MGLLQDLAGSAAQPSGLTQNEEMGQRLRLSKNVAKQAEEQTTAYSTTFPQRNLSSLIQAGSVCLLCVQHRNRRQVSFHNNQCAPNSSLQRRLPTSLEAKRIQKMATEMLPLIWSPFNKVTPARGYRTNIVSRLWNLTVRANFPRSHKGLKREPMNKPKPIFTGQTAQRK